MIYEKKWSETEEVKKQLLQIINERFYFQQDGTILCRKCRNESIACVCMDEDYMSGECDKCGEDALECECEPSEVIPET